MTMKIKRSLFFRAFVLLFIALFFMVGINNVMAFVNGLGSVRVVVDDEVRTTVHTGNAIVTLKCSGQSGAHWVTDQTASDSNTSAGIIDIASTSATLTGCANNNTLKASISLDGFVTASISKSFTTANKYVTATLNRGVASLSFTLHVNGVEDQLGNSLTLDGSSASISYSNSNVRTATVSYSGGKAYVTASPNDSNPVASAGYNGYVNKQISLTSLSITSSQSAYFGTGGGSVNYTGSGLPFAYKFTVYERGGSPTSNLISGATVTAGNSGSIGCAMSGAGLYYCAVPPSHTGTTATAGE